MTEQSVQEHYKASVRRLFEEVFQGADMEVLDELVATDITDHNPVHGQPDGIDGIRYVIRFLHEGIGSPRFTVEDLVAEGDRVVARWRLSGVSTGASPELPPAGTPMDDGIIVIFRMVEGKIVERWAGFQRDRPEA